MTRREGRPWATSPSSRKRRPRVRNCEFRNVTISLRGPAARRGTVGRVTPRAFRLLDVFHDGTPFSGNPLAVFEDGVGLDTATMQAVALQMNLSETTFVFPPPAGATAAVRIFSPGFEMPFAGHPTLGTAHVVRALRGGDLDEVVLSLPVGPIPVRTRGGDVLSLAAKVASSRPGPARAHAAALVGVGEDEVVGDAPWIDAGSEQLLVEVKDEAAVERATVRPELLARHGANRDGQGLVLVFARRGADVHARFFFDKQGQVVEDPGTGSAAANLGSLLAARGERGAFVVHQGRRTGRPCRLEVEVTGEGRVHVAGRVREVGTGVLRVEGASSVATRGGG